MQEPLENKQTIMNNTHYSKLTRAYYPKKTRYILILSIVKNENKLRDNTLIIQISVIIALLKYLYTFIVDSFSFIGKTKFNIHEDRIV